ncbi:MAG: hypothetical protein WAS50_00025, partial [Nitrospira sp.]
TLGDLPIHELLQGIRERNIHALHGAPPALTSNNAIHRERWQGLALRVILAHAHVSGRVTYTLCASPDLDLSVRDEAPAFEFVRMHLRGIKSVSLRM